MAHRAWGMGKICALRWRARTERREISFYPMPNTQYQCDDALLRDALLRDARR